MWMSQRSSGWRVLLVAALVFGSLPAAATAVRAAGPVTGDPTPPSPAVDERPAGRLAAAPVLDTASPAASDPQASPRVQAVEAVTNSIDTSSREAVTQAYNEQYLANRGAAQGWTGSVSTCKRGSVNAGYIAAVTSMVNYFRGMTGLPGVAMSSSLNSLDQAAALIMDANDTLTHAPTSGMDCYTQDGYDGASHSNICLGCIGPSAIDAYMYDFGSGNTAVGHRRWILYPPQTLLGTGSTTQADALYVLHTSTWSRPADAPTWISWPPKGFVPYSQVYPRFSLSRQGAAFGAATVQVKVDGAAVAGRHRLAEWRLRRSGARVRGQRGLARPRRRRPAVRDHGRRDRRGRFDREPHLADDVVRARCRQPVRRGCDRDLRYPGARDVEGRDRRGRLPHPP